MYEELEIVNHILQTLGESTTPTLETQHPAVVQARQLLEGYNKEFQGTGWWFNKLVNLKLLPNTDGRVGIPADTLNFVVSAVPACSIRAGERFVKKGKFVYDTVEHTDIISRAVYVNITTLTAIEDLPAAAGSYLKHLAAENAFLDDDGDLGQHARLSRRTSQAWAVLQSEQLKAVRANALKTPQAQWALSGPRNYQAGYNPAIIGG